MRPESSLAALVVALLMVGSLPAAAAAAAPVADDADRPVPVADAQPTPADVRPLSVGAPDHAENDTADPADTVYVTEDGDLVLVYRNDSDEFDGRLGVNVSEGLVHLLLSNETDSNVTGDLAATLTRERFVGNGSVVTERPESVEELDLEASTVQTDEASSTAVSLRATLTNDSAWADQVASLRTEGQLRVTPSTYEFTGAATVQGGSTAVAPSEFAASVTETDAGYRLRVERNDTVSVYFKSRWDSRENATETIEAQYNATARSLNGTVDVRLQSYEFTEVDNRTYRLDVAYTVEYRGVHEAVADRLTESLAESRNLSLSEAEAREVSDRVQEFEVRRVAFSSRTEGDRATLSTRIRLENYDAFSRALLDVAAASDELAAEDRERIESARARLDARAAAGLVRTADWQGEVASDSRSVTVDFSLSADTVNWQAYVEELDDRGLEFTELEYEVTARTAGDEIEATVSATVEDEQLVDDLLSPNPGATAADTESSETLRQLREAGFRRAKLNASLAEGRVTTEMAARFENLSTLQDALSESAPGEVQSLLSRTEDGQRVIYVRVTGAVDDDPTEAEIRELSVADEDTEVRMPDEHDGDFPTMDVESAQAYLGYDPASGATTATRTATGGDGTTPTSVGTGVPGFGPLVAAVALAAVAVLFRRRRR